MHLIFVLLFYMIKAIRYSFNFTTLINIEVEPKVNVALSAESLELLMAMGMGWAWLKEGKKLLTHLGKFSLPAVGNDSCAETKESFNVRMP